MHNFFKKTPLKEEKSRMRRWWIKIGLYFRTKRFKPGEDSISKGMFWNHRIRRNPEHGPKIRFQIKFSSTGVDFSIQTLTEEKPTFKKTFQRRPCRKKSESWHNRTTNWIFSHFRPKKISINEINCTLFKPRIIWQWKQNSPFGNLMEDFEAVIFAKNDLQHHVMSILKALLQFLPN